MITMFLYMYTALDCLYNHLHVEPRTILIGTMDQNLKLMIGPIHLIFSFTNLDFFFEFKVTLIFKISDLLYFLTT